MWQVLSVQCKAILKTLSNLVLVQSLADAFLKTFCSDAAHS